MSRPRDTRLLVLLTVTLLSAGCSTQVGEWHWNVGPLLTNEPYDADGSRKEPVDPSEWRKYYESTKTSDVPAKVESPE